MAREGNGDLSDRGYKREMVGWILGIEKHTPMQSKETNKTISVGERELNFGVEVVDVGRAVIRLDASRVTISPIAIAISTTPSSHSLCLFLLLSSSFLFNFIFFVSLFKYSTVYSIQTVLQSLHEQLSTPGGVLFVR